MDFRNLENKWIVLQVRGGREELCSLALSRKGYEQFLPLCRFDSPLKSRSARYRARPLFPGYVFCRFSCKATGLLVTTPGLIRIMAYGGVPCQISDDEISNISLLTQTGRPVSKASYIQVGERVRVTTGPLTGLEGVIVDIRNSKRLIVSISAIYRSISVEVNGEAVVPVSEFPRHYAEESSGFRVVQLS